MDMQRSLRFILLLIPCLLDMKICLYFCMIRLMTFENSSMYFIYNPHLCILRVLNVLKICSFHFLLYLCSQILSLLSHVFHLLYCISKMKIEAPDFTKYGQVEPCWLLWCWSLSHWSRHCFYPHLITMPLPPTLFSFFIQYTSACYHIIPWHDKDVMHRNSSKLLCCSAWTILCTKPSMGNGFHCWHSRQSLRYLCLYWRDGVFSWQSVKNINTKLSRGDSTAQGNE